jgi:hypothetical protein
MKFDRRTLVALGATTGLLGLYAMFKWRFGDATEVVVAILKRRVGYLRVESESFHVFAKDYVVFRKEYEQDLKKLSVASLPLRFMSPYAWLDQGHAFRRLEDNVVSKFLLSTDFFQNGGNDRTLVKYLSFYDPQRAVCRNPLARRE